MSKSTSTLSTDDAETATLAISAPRTSAAQRRWLRVLLGLLLGVVVMAATAGLLGYRVTRRFNTSEVYPESATGLRSVSPVRAPRELVVAADPQAARAAQALLDRGGSALDALLGAALVLGLVEPQSSGLGGGAFLLYWDEHTKKLHAYDGREVAPASADKNLFMRDGQPLNFARALVGGRSVGVPGALRMLELAHARHGQLPWGASFEEPMRLASEGFVVSSRLSKLIALDPVLATLPATRAAFYGASRDPLSAGSKRINSAYARTLRAIADGGASAFYTGTLARDMVQAVHAARQPTITRAVWNLALGELGMSMGGTADVPASGELALPDLASYRPLERDPLCMRYRAYRVCSMPPPAGGMVLLEALALLERFPLGDYAPLSVDALHLLAEAQRIAFADRDAWLADPQFSEVPVAALLDPSYVRQRSSAIAMAHELGHVEAGKPVGAHSDVQMTRASELPCTTHISVVDRDGNVAAMTSSIEFAFGSHVMVDGFLLNNQLTDFSFRPEHEGKLVANAVAPGKRPRSAMSPTLIFDAETGKPLAALGSPGGPGIIGYVLQTVVALLDWKLDPQRAVALPHVINRNGKTELEDLGWPSRDAREHMVHELQARGHDVSVGQQNSGLHVVWLGADALSAGVDPRREGAALGD